MRHTVGAWPASVSADTWMMPAVEVIHSSAHAEIYRHLPTNTPVLTPPFATPDLLLNARHLCPKSWALNLAGAVGTVLKWEEDLLEVLFFSDPAQREVPVSWWEEAAASAEDCRLLIIFVWKPTPSCIIPPLLILQNFLLRGCFLNSTWGNSARE